MYLKNTMKRLVFRSKIPRLKFSRASSTHKVHPNLICFKDWSSGMVQEILKSAQNLKNEMKSSGTKGMGLLKDLNITMIFEEHEPILKLAVCKAIHMMGGHSSSLSDKIRFDQEYMGSVFSVSSDMLFVSSNTHQCVERFMQEATVPVVCMRSRVHQSIQALATLMAVEEQYKSIKDLRITYIGRPAPILNSFLLLCPMLGANFKFLCCCKEAPVHPLLFKLGEDMCEKSGTELKECSEKSHALEDCQVVIAGPARDPTKKPVKDTFNLALGDIEDNSDSWIFIHTIPKGPEVSNDLFNHTNSRTFDAIGNLPFIAAALMANSMKQHLF